ncbi:hypothetical protein FB475_0448 [Kribbella jejuensis]|uniref:HNH endonuclease n=2 Tax=Kribbella jejuensis TaxID=236068 RepID=A0A542EM77_9ACTN|nr:hypothetical protein FB475_0448 [Kribbella jejuensis]
MVRGALWLIQEVGEGNIFTKEQVRRAFPGVSQADRRIRDLRKYGWNILPSNSDVTLHADEQRFVKAGVPVWDNAARHAASPDKLPSAAEKQAVMEQADHMCVVCGISGGEAYADDSNQTAVLFVSRRPMLMPDGAEVTTLTVECRRCHAGRSSTYKIDVGDVIESIAMLELDDLRRLRRWMIRGRKEVSALDRVWSAYLRLPAAAQEAVRSAVEDS